METQREKKSVIFVGYDCNNNCKFCMEQDVRGEAPQTKKEVMNHMVGARKRGSTYLEMIGGEITIRSDFIELISFAKSLGFETVMIATNGRMFAYKKHAYKAIEAGLNSIVFSIHGPTPEIHDGLTRAEGSFDQLHKGLKNIKEAVDHYDKDIHLGSNTTIVKQNYKHLPELGEHIKSLGITNSEFIFVDCNEGGAYNNFSDLVPRISEAAPYIKKCLDLVDVKNNRNNWDIRYVPLCYFKDYLDQVSELREIKTFKTEQLGRDSNQTGYDYEEKRKNFTRIKPEKCEGCALYDYCEGIWKTYYNKFGDEELKPVLELTEEQKNKLNI
ncbi:MAG: radical SAM protein [Candidatus Woesearchaeota archaeon]